MTAQRIFRVSKEEMPVVTKDPGMAAVIREYGGVPMIPRSERNYIDTEDRVIIVGDGGDFGADNLTPHQGKHGIVLSNDGSGFCRVRLDDNNIVYAWNRRDLAWEKD